MKIKTKDFDLKATIESGQIFQFIRHPKNIYEIILEGVSVKIRQTGDNLFCTYDSDKDLRKSITEYFDIERDLNPLFEIFDQDIVLKPLLNIKGIRLIKQNPWVTVGSFIISANNNIKRIESICKKLGLTLEKNELIFPHYSKISKSSESFLRKQGLGYRAEYLMKTAKILSDNPDWENTIRNLNYCDAKEWLLKCPGIGNKVADCVLLYGFQKFEGFPVDTWIEKIMTKLYFKHETPTRLKILMFAHEKWGEMAGYIQQYLFYGSRMGKI